MHSIVRRFLKTAFVFLVTGLALGVWLLARRELYGEGPTLRAMSAHTHALLIGFVMMVIAGVALWIFPRPATGTAYRPVLAEAAWWCLTPATAVRVLGEFFAPVAPAMGLRVVIFAAGALQAVGLALVFWALFPRIRAAGSAQREAKGEKF